MLSGSPMGLTLPKLSLVPRQPFSTLSECPADAAVSGQASVVDLLDLSVATACQESS